MRGLFNGGLLALALGLAVVATRSGAVQGAGPVPAPEFSADRLGPLVDDRGVSITPRAFQRIASMHPVADHLLLRLVEPGRLVAVSADTRRVHPEGWRFGELRAIPRVDPLEVILGASPDLLIASPFVDEDVVARVRGEGIAVFDLGQLLGVESTLVDIDVLGELLLEPQRAERLRAGFERDLAALRADAAARAPVDGIYLALYGDSFFGGTAGTSYGDVLGLAGVHDLAGAAGFRDWPQYSAEELLELDPPLIVTQAGMEPAIRGHQVLSQLAACREGGRIVGVDPAYNADAGLGVIEAARAVARALDAGASSPSTHNPSTDPLGPSHD